MRKGRQNKRRSRGNNGYHCVLDDNPPNAAYALINARVGRGHPDSGVSDQGAISDILRVGYNQDRHRGINKGLSRRILTLVLLVSLSIPSLHKPRKYSIFIRLIR